MGFGPPSSGPPGLPGSRDTGVYSAEFPFKAHSKRFGEGHRAHHLYCPPNKETKVAGLPQDPGA